LPYEWKEIVQECDVLLLQRSIPTKVLIAAAKQAREASKKPIVFLDTSGSD
jgi:hypothetical protein